MKQGKVWQAVLLFFQKTPEPRVEKSDQELIDLADNYKEMMEMPAWKHFEGELKAKFDLAGEEMEYDRLGKLKDKDVDYYQLKIAQAKRQMCREIMLINFLVIGQGVHKKKEKIAKGETDDGAGK